MRSVGWVQVHFSPSPAGRQARAHCGGSSVTPKRKLKAEMSLDCAWLANASAASKGSALKRNITLQTDKQLRRTWKAEKAQLNIFNRLKQASSLATVFAVSQPMNSVDPTGTPSTFTPDIHGTAGATVDAEAVGPHCLHLAITLRPI